MNISFEGNTLTLKIEHFLDQLEDEELEKLVEKACFRDKLFDAICDRLISGETKNGNWVIPDHVAHKWRIRLLSKIDGVAYHLVKKLVNSELTLKKQLDDWQEYAHEMSRAWKGEWKPEMPSYLEADTEAPEEELKAIANKITKGVKQTGDTK